MSHVNSHIIQKLTEFGLNCVGIAGGENYQDILPGCQSVVIFGSSGSQLWDNFYQYCKQHPKFLSQNEHPFDRYVQLKLNETIVNSKNEDLWIRCSATDSRTVDFRKIALDAGMGWRSPTGILLSPEHGLWMGLRLACFSKEKLSPTQLTGEPICHSCDKPCISSCPAGAITEAGWNYQKCSDYHRQSNECHQGCIARVVCPIGKEHQSPPLARFYHHNKPAGRITLAKSLGIKNAGTVADTDYMMWHDKP